VCTFGDAQSCRTAAYEFIVEENLRAIGVGGDLSDSKAGNDLRAGSGVHHGSAGRQLCIRRGRDAFVGVGAGRIKMMKNARRSEALSAKPKPATL
jgi:hypothetical protein